MHFVCKEVYFAWGFVTPNLKTGSSWISTTCFGYMGDYTAQLSGDNQSTMIRIPKKTTRIMRRKRFFSHMVLWIFSFLQPVPATVRKLNLRVGLMRLQQVNYLQTVMIESLDFFLHALHSLTSNLKLTQLKIRKSSEPNIQFKLGVPCSFSRMIHLIRFLIPVCCPAAQASLPRHCAHT